MRAGTRRVLQRLRDYESRNVTFIEADGSWPIVWERARGAAVWDADGKKYLDLTAAFGVAAAGHANPRVVRAGQRQMARLLHAMGDVHPHALKASLARELSRLTFERWGAGRAKTIFCNSGFEAVEVALKTAMLATGNPGVIAFQGAYHGLGYGALNVTHRQYFSLPFRRQLREFARFVPFPRRSADLEAVESRVGRLLGRQEAKTVLVEPIQARGGINLPPAGFLPLLRRLCREHGALLVLDEIYTGFGRTGRWFACEHAGVAPDLVCLGKALTGGFPLSACVGRAELMDAAWPPSTGEALHTSTFLGHPVGCAMALAQIQEIGARGLVERSASLGQSFLEWLRAEVRCARLHSEIRGLGLMTGVELRLPDGRPATDATLAVVKEMLHRGFILLPEGEAANVIGFTPPLTISRGQLRATVRALAEVLAR
ncbi:MAG TPA: aspartate aminotransferase family protein [Verrucomicrobiota bacterium]|nr:aspartate aminotransferase family protein [Verrucomicrobiota bacterium]HRT57842.1 aspartate aminotransferase family protein [Candidatus Paceibacterota bacterium]